jgi:hypothetical protein
MLSDGTDLGCNFEIILYLGISFAVALAGNFKFMFLVDKKAYPPTENTFVTTVLIGILFLTIMCYGESQFCLGTNVRKFSMQLASSWNFGMVSGRHWQSKCTVRGGNSL